MRSAINVNPMFVRFLRVWQVTNRLMRLYRGKRCRMGSIHPPPVVILIHARLMFRRFTHANCLPKVQLRNVRVHVDLRAGLVVARGRVVVALPVTMLPLFLIIALHTFPFVVFYPHLKVNVAFQVANRRRRLRVSHVVNNVIPRETPVLQVNLLPVIVRPVSGLGRFFQFQLLDNT